MTETYAYDVPSLYVFLDSLSSNSPKFTGKERDKESGLDNFGARFDSSSMGRFMSPDDVGAEDGEDNPQGLNLYGYVQNNPINATDPDGHDCVFVVGNTAGLQRGDCSNAPSNATNVTYVPGTVDEKSGQYNRDTGTLTVTYTPYGDTGKALSVIGDVNPTHPGPTESDKFASAMTAGANNVSFISKQVAIQAIAGAIGRLMGAGLEAFLAARAANAAEVAEVTNLAAKAANAIGNQDAVVSNEAAAKAAAQEFLGPGAEPITDRATGAFRGWKSADGTRVVIDTHADAVGEHMNFVNKTTGGNLHVRW